MKRVEWDVESFHLARHHAVLPTWLSAVRSDSCGSIATASRGSVITPFACTRVSIHPHAPGCLGRPMRVLPMELVRHRHRWSGKELQRRCSDGHAITCRCCSAILGTTASTRRSLRRCVPTSARRITSTTGFRALGVHTTPTRTLVAVARYVLASRGMGGASFLIHVHVLSGRKRVGHVSYLKVIRSLKQDRLMLVWK